MFRLLRVVNLKRTLIKTSKRKLFVTQNPYVNYHTQNPYNENFRKSFPVLCFKKNCPYREIEEITDGIHKMVVYCPKCIAEDAIQEYKKRFIYLKYK